jgi:MFS family permease
MTNSAGLGEAIASVILVPLVLYSGRRRAMILSLIVASVCFLLGMIPWQWTDVWSFERLISLIAIVAVTCSFSLAFLYTNELAPTTHRGLVFSCSSLIARCCKYCSCSSWWVYGSTSLVRGFREEKFLTLKPCITEGLRSREGKVKSHSIVNWHCDPYW